jgi:hypothetical protein
VVGPQGLEQGQLHDRAQPVESEDVAGEQVPVLHSARPTHPIITSQTSPHYAETLGVARVALIATPQLLWTGSAPARRLRWRFPSNRLRDAWTDVMVDRSAN